MDTVKNTRGGQIPSLNPLIRLGTIQRSLFVLWSFTGNVKITNCAVVVFFGGEGRVADALISRILNFTLSFALISFIGKQIFFQIALISIASINTNFNFL